ncbi:outer membrane lipoprotein-sorting protein [Candidatus Bipolaricaulota bacterium]|nr:outer membrane lipoprotein-sorting protein [Candidatus Bipolaricaulota bacterium]
MKRSIFAGLLIALFILSGWSVAADEVSPLTIMERARAIWTVESFHAVVGWEITTAEEVQTVSMEVWMVGVDTALMRILAPEEEAGTGYLLLGDELWYYSPLIGEAIPLPAILLHEGLLGSGMALDDLFRGALADRYRIEFAPDQPDTGYVLHLYPLPGEPLVYGRLVVTLRADYAVQRIEYYDQREGLIRTALFSEITAIGDLLIPFVVTIEDADGDRTVQTIKSLVPDLEIDPAIFTIEHLEGD